MNVINKIQKSHENGNLANALMVRLLPRRIHFFLMRKNKYNLPWYKCLKSYILGFTAEEYVIYDLDNNNYREYLSEYERYKFRDAVKDYRMVFDNKMLFLSMISAYAPINKVFGYKKKVYVSLNGEDNFQDLIIANKKVVMKTLSDSGGGLGFHILEFRDNNFYDNKIKTNWGFIEKLLKESDDYILEEFTIQTDFENQIFPHTVNTIRVVTVQTKAGAIKVMKVIHRMGAVSDACVDNASLGGMFAFVDPETGEMSALHSYSPDILFDNAGNRKKDIPIHPTTGKKIEGLKVPNIKYILSEACRIHESILFTGAKFIAWDFALTSDGYRVIEGNTSCGFKFLQFLEGQRNKELGLWMKSWKYIK